MTAGDLWIISSDTEFAQEKTILCCSTFYGANSDGQIELGPLPGEPNARWPVGA